MSTQPDIYDLLAEDGQPDELYHLVIREDATGPVARWAGQQATTEPLPQREAEEIRAATPNGAHMDVVPSRPCPTCGHNHYPGMAKQVGRFQPDRTPRYRAQYVDAPERATRDEAIADMCRHLTEVSA